jgi:glycosyltransferase involved in cell wall biosynthesis
MSRVSSYRTSCLVINYNYGRFVCEAVASALAQAVPFDEIIVVDDGSTDDSLAKLAASFGHDSRVRIIAQPNGGHLSAFNRGFSESSGDILFFLDADDLYEPAMLEEVLRVYSQDDAVGMVFLPTVLFGQVEGVDCVWSPRESKRGARQIRGFDPRRDDWEAIGRSFNYSGGRSENWVFKRAVYSVTSALSLKREVLARFLPMPCEGQWHARSNADAYLYNGAAFANVSRYYLHRPLVRYRVHGNNSFFGMKATAEEWRAINAETDVLRLKLARRMGLPQTPEGIAAMIAEDYGGVGLLGKRFRDGWRAFGLASLPRAVAWKWRWRFLWRTVLGESP